MDSDIETIHESLENGQRRQMAEQIDEYGSYDFFSQYDQYLRDMYAPTMALNFFTDCVISYHRIKNR